MVFKRMLWLCYLIDHEQFATDKGVASSTNPITCGVIQGSMLNPLCVISTTYEISATAFHFFLFNDDTNMFQSILRYREIA